MIKKNNQRKTERITIEFAGNKRFKQALVDCIYLALKNDELIEETAKPGCSLSISSSIAPNEDLE